MKRAACAFLAALMMISLAACSVLPNNKDAANTAAPTDEATEAPTAAPTEAPTEAPTPEPPAETPVPVYPTPGALGKLCEGPIFPEPVKYLVLKGDGDLFYVYNNIGELVRAFSAVDDEYDHTYAGFFGEDGICHNVRVATGEHVPYFEILGDMIFTTEWIFEDDYWGACLRSVLDDELNEIVSFETGEYMLGPCGGVLHIDGNYLVFDRDIGDWSMDTLSYTGMPKLLGPDGSFIREVDPTPFGGIAGVYGGKYIVGCTFTGEYDEWEERIMEYSLYTLDGKLVMKNVDPVQDSWFCSDDELGFIAEIRSFSYLTDENGVCYDSELNVVDSVPEYGADNALRERYWNLRPEGYEVVYWGMFQGVKNDEGEWLFKIFDPAYAEDHDPWGYGWY